MSIPDGENRKIERMGSCSTARLLLEFSIPACLSLLISALYTFVDGIFIGQALSDVGIAASTASYPMFLLMLAIACLVGQGGNALAALRLGEGLHDEAERILGNSVSLGLISAAILAAICLPLLDPILYLCGCTDEALPLAHSYLGILVAGFVSMVFSTGICNFMRTAGSPNLATVSSVSGALLNVFLDWLFIIVWGWGMVGAAVATLIGQFLSMGIVLAFFCRSGAALRLRLSYLRLDDAKRTKDILVLGVASFITEASIALSNLVINNLFRTYGGAESMGATGALAAMGAIERVSQLFFLPIIGISMGMQPLIGYNYGAGNWERVRLCFKQACLGATAIATLLWGICLLFPGFFLGLFALEEGSMPFAIWALRIYMLFVPILGFQVIGSNYFQATGQASKATLLITLRQVIGMNLFMIITPILLPPISSFSPMESVMIGVAINDVLSTLLTALFVWQAMGALRAHSQAD